MSTFHAVVWMDPTDAQLEAQARQYFKKFDEMAGGASLI